MKKLKVGSAIVLVDDENFEYIKQFKWYIVMGYAVRLKISKGKRTTFFMHREIMKVPKGKFTNHINCNRSDNRKSNLRICTIQQNNFHRRPNKNNKLGIKGVREARTPNKWVAQIEHFKKCYHVGTFNSVIEAGKAYDKKAKELFGEWAHINFP